MTGWALICFVVLVALATARSLAAPGRSRGRRPATRGPALGPPVETLRFSPAPRARTPLARRDERG